MRRPAFDEVQVGDAIGPLRLPAITRLTLALYCGASNDHYAIHVDSDFAKAHGLDDVIGHGMLSMAYLGRLLGDWADPRAIRSFQCRFVAATRVGDVPVVRGRVDEKIEGRERRARVSLRMENQCGELKVRGEALVALA